MIICGHLRSNRNYALHSDDIVEQNTPFGGALEYHLLEPKSTV